MRTVEQEINKYARTLAAAANGVISYSPSQFDDQSVWSKLRQKLNSLIPAKRQRPSARHRPF